MSYKEWLAKQNAAQGIEAVPVFSEEVWDAATAQSAKEIERLRTRLAALEAAVDEVLSKLLNNSERITREMLLAMYSLRAARGQQTGV